MITGSAVIERFHGAEVGSPGGVEVLEIGAATGDKVSDDGGNDQTEGEEKEAISDIPTEEWRASMPEANHEHSQGKENHVDQFDFKRDSEEGAGEKIGGARVGLVEAYQ